MKKTKLLRAALEKELRENCHTKTGKIEICWEDTTIVIRGRVKNYYQKQMAFNIVKNFGVDVAIRDDVIVD